MKPDEIEAAREEGRKEVRAQLAVVRQDMEANVRTSGTVEARIAYRTAAERIKRVEDGKAG